MSGPTAHTAGRDKNQDKSNPAVTPEPGATRFGFLLRFRSWAACCGPGFSSVKRSCPCFLVLVFPSLLSWSLQTGSTVVRNDVDQRFVDVFYLLKVNEFILIITSYLAIFHIQCMWAGERPTDGVDNESTTWCLDWTLPERYLNVTWTRLRQRPSRRGAERDSQALSGVGEISSGGTAESGCVHITAVAKGPNPICFPL